MFCIGGGKYPRAKAVRWWVTLAHRCPNAGVWGVPPSSFEVSNCIRLPSSNFAGVETMSIQKVPAST